MKAMKLLFLFFLVSFSALVAARNLGYGSQYVDPENGMLDMDKACPDYKGPVFTPYVDDKDIVSSTHFEGENRMVFTMKDGSTHVFERDPFIWNPDGTEKKDRPWVQTR